MVAHLKRYFWAISLGFIALASSMGAGVVNTFVGSALEPAPLLPGDATPRPASPASLVKPSLDVARFGHLFGIEPPPPPPPDALPQEAQAQKDICLDCAPVKSNLRLQLLATMVASDKRWSMALVSDLDKQSSAYYFIGEKMKGATVKDIVRDPQRVIIINEETRRVEYIDGVPGSGAAAVNTSGLPSLGTAPIPPPGDGESGPAGNVPVEGITKTGDGKYNIKKEKIDSVLGNLNEVATQARIVPSFKNGTANGFKLFSIRPGSLYSAIGIENGDVITKINGFEMNSPEKALEIYTRLKDAKNVKIEYERRGAMMSSEYNIQ